MKKCYTILSLLCSTALYASENLNAFDIDHKGIVNQTYADGEDKERFSASILADLPSDIITRVVWYSDKKDKISLYQTSKQMKNIVENRDYQSIRSMLNTFSHDTEEKDFNSHGSYTRNLLEKVCPTLIAQNGYLFVPQGSLMVGYLSNNYKFLSLYPFLNDQAQDWTKQLFQAVFGQALPKDKWESAIGKLNACLPVNHIYVEKSLENPIPVFKKFMEQNKNHMLHATKAQNKDKKYFLVGIDSNTDALNEHPHVIVVNQSHVQALKALEQFLPKDHKHTVILNADQKVLSLSTEQVPAHITQLILTNGNHQCTRINNSFLCGYDNLISVVVQDLTQVEFIGNSFLISCQNLYSLDTRGFGNVTIINEYFVAYCKNLQSFNIKNLGKVKKIGRLPFDECPVLQSAELQTWLKQIHEI